MKKNSLTNQDFAALGHGIPVPLTVTMEGTGSATAWLAGSKIFVLCVAAQNGKYVNISTPIEFDFLHMHLVHGNATTCSVQALNTAGAITDDVTVAASDTDEDDSTTIDDTYWSFSVDDNDLRFEITTGAFTGLIIVDINK